MDRLTTLRKIEVPNLLMVECEDDDAVLNRKRNDVLVVPAVKVSRALGGAVTVRHTHLINQVVLVVAKGQILSVPLQAAYLTEAYVERESFERTSALRQFVKERYLAMAAADAVHKKVALIVVAEVFIPVKILVGVGLRRLVDVLIDGDVRRM